MSSHSRFGEQTIVNSFNLFVDTERTNICGDRSSSGDDTTIHFEGSSIIANDGELIKLTLTNFEMYNNLYSVDINNDRFTTTYSNNSLAIVPPATEAPALIFTSADDRIINKNYATLGEMAIEFAKTISKRITLIKPTIVRFKITIKNLFKNLAATNDDDKNTYSFVSTADNTFPNSCAFSQTDSAGQIIISRTQMDYWACRDEGGNSTDGFTVTWVDGKRTKYTFGPDGIGSIVGTNGSVYPIKWRNDIKNGDKVIITSHEDGATSWIPGHVN
jgi:hypothetical protein